MSENKFLDLESKIGSLRSKYDQGIVPQQEEVLSALTVGSINDYLGQELSDKIERAFSRPAVFHSEKLFSIARQIANQDNVREISIGQDTYLVRRTTLSEHLTSTEIFSPDTKDIVDKGIQFLFYLVTDNRTNLTANILDLVDENSGAKIMGQFLVMNSGRYNFSSRNVELPLVYYSPKDNAVGTFTRETGHSHQYPNLGLVGFLIGQVYKYFPILIRERTPAEVVVSERNAAAFALAAARKYRSLGVDITDIVTVENTEDALRTYNDNTVPKHLLPSHSDL